MTCKEAVEALKRTRLMADAYQQATGIMYWDMATDGGIPQKAVPSRSRAQGMLAGEAFKLSVSDEVRDCIETLRGRESELSEPEAAMLRSFDRHYRRAHAIPPDEVAAFEELTNISEMAWMSAKKDSDFGRMLPYYEKIFDFKRRCCDWYGYEKHPYDALLDEYEEGLTVETLDGFFSLLRAEIVPLLKMVMASGKKPRELTGSFAVEGQKELNRLVAKTVGFDFERGRIAETEHPFCMGLSMFDTRLTTHYHENDLLSALFSTIHEAGHGVYDQNQDEALEEYGLATGVTTGFHESQSRLFENILARSRPFCSFLLPHLVKIYPQLSDWDEEALFRAVNIARPILIRIEADELTYCLHILIRYELEKGIATGAVSAADLPRLWNDKYEEILGVRPSCDREGVLQDTHWANGYLGYFPTYALGTAMSAQIALHMGKAVDVGACLKAGDFSPIVSWLHDNFHRHGAMRLPGRLLLDATGEPFNPRHYTDYLKEKFTGLYS